MRMERSSPAAVMVCMLAIALPGRIARAAEYPAENIHDTAVGPDEALVNVSLRSSRWPDCTTLESAIADVFRLEGVVDKPDQDKALAMWKWFRILVGSTGGGYAYEGAPGQQQIVYDPHKIFAVYGHHQCDGLSWAMAPLWRAAGYMAFDAATHGHTTAALRYRDADGVQRYHGFDPQARIYWWDEQAQRVSTRSMPVMTGMVYRHVLAPQRVHTLRTSLRIGELLQRNWQNTGHVVPSVTREPYSSDAYYLYDKPGKSNGIYAVAGEQVQSFILSADPQVLARQLCEGSANFACTAEAQNARPPGAVFHPAKGGTPGILIFRLGPPYVIVDARLAATLHKARQEDTCRLYLARDDGPWQLLLDKQSTGPGAVAIELGREARKAGKPDAYTAYALSIKCEFLTAGESGGVGMSAPNLTVRRMFNKRALPNLMPGENCFKVAAAKLADGWALKLTVDYQLNDETAKSEHLIAKLPYYFRIDAPGVELRKIRSWNYDQDFNNEAVRMLGYSMELVPARGAKLTESLPAEEVEPAFAKSFPHPADMTHRRITKTPETDPMQTSGFFPQSRLRLEDKEKMNALIRQLNNNGDSSYEAWSAAQELGNYPDSVDWLCRRLGKANIDLTLFIVKALAQIGDAKAIEPLLGKWRQGPNGAPGTRYIPDALAEISARSGKVDPRIVPALVSALEQVRFDFRFHVAHALGELGGEEAAKALRDLVANDPFPAVREEARAALEKIQRRPR